MTKKSKPASKAKARGREQVALPGLEPSPAWQKMKTTPKGQRSPKQKVHRVDAGPGHPSWRNAVIPGKCTCEDTLFEDKDHPEGVKRNPWIMGHLYWCSMWMAKCDDCGMSGGAHLYTCSFWKLHPTITPF